MWKWISIAGMEIVLFGLTALISPEIFREYLWLLIYCGVFLVLLGITFEHWPKLLQFREDYYWADLEAAARMFRDEVEKRGLSDVANLIDTLTKETTSEHPSTTATLGWLKDGANCEQIQVTGVLKNGLGRRHVPIPLKDTLLSQALRELPENEIVGADGNVYSDIRFGKTGIRSYVLFLLK